MVGFNQVSLILMKTFIYILYVYVRAFVSVSNFPQIDWSASALVFQIDRKTVRTLMASDYVVNGVVQYPTTPSRIQLSLWPAGTNASAAGTVQWAGGMINWQDPDYIAAGMSQYCIVVFLDLKTC